MSAGRLSRPTANHFSPALVTSSFLSDRVTVMLVPLPVHDRSTEKQVLNRLPPQ